MIQYTMEMVYQLSFFDRNSHIISDDVYNRTPPSVTEAQYEQPISNETNGVYEMPIEANGRDPNPTLNTDLNPQPDPQCNSGYPQNFPRCNSAEYLEV